MKLEKIPKFSICFLFQGIPQIKHTYLTFRHPIHWDLDKVTKKSSVFQGKFFLYDLFFQNFHMKYSIGWYPSNKVLYIVVGKLKWLLKRKDQNKLIEVWVYTQLSLLVIPTSLLKYIRHNLSRSRENEVSILSITFTFLRVPLIFGKNEYKVFDHLI